MPCFDLPLSQRTVSSPSIVLSQCGRSKVPTAQPHLPAEYTFFICTWHTLQYPLLWCTACSQNFSLTSLSISQYTVHKTRRLLPSNCVSISIHHQTMTGWCIMNWNGRGRKWSWPVWRTTATFAWRDRERPMKICQGSCYHGQYSHQVLPSEPIPSVNIYNIHLAKYTSVDVNAQSKVRWWASYCGEDPM